jgi:hypothetical protein
MIDNRTEYEREDDIIVNGLLDQAEESDKKARLSMKHSYQTLAGAVIAFGNGLGVQRSGEMWPTEVYEMKFITGILGLVAVGHLGEATFHTFKARRKNRFAATEIEKAESESKNLPVY